MNFITAWFVERSMPVVKLIGFCLLFSALVPNLSQTNDGSNRFTNEAGQPIMAADMDRVSKRSGGGDTPTWTEGHRWEPQLRRRHQWKDAEVSRAGSRNDRSHFRLSRSTRLFLFFLVLGLIVVRIVLGVIVYRDLSADGTSRSSLWILVVLFAGTPGAIAYGLFRLVHVMEQTPSDEHSHD